MLMKRHAAIWRVFASHLNVVHRSIQTFNHHTDGNVKFAPRFLHVVLPNLGKDLDRGLKTGLFVLTAPVKRCKSSALPEFLYELFIQVFDKNGYIKQQPVGIKALRQLLYLFYKFEMPFTATDREIHGQAFIDRDMAVKISRYPLGLEEVRKNFLRLLPDNPKDIRPRHSNGASAVRVTNSEKLYRRTHYAKLFAQFGPKYFFNTYDHAKSWSESFTTVTAEPYSKISFVPKDSRGPRTICMEPHEYMFIQQGLMHLLYDFIEKYSPAKGYINFTDQSINQQLAYSSSINDDYATIDMKDASDMVPKELVLLLSSSDWWEALSACRTPATLCNGDLHTLRKFAPMGSALCFPIEAMVFWSILKTVAPEVWVYGDDIIVHKKYAHDCISALESYGLIVNHDKTLIEGHFKESCGAEYYNGHDITYVKCKSYGFLEAVAFCNEITEHYGLTLSSKVLSLIEHQTEKIYFREPLIEKDCPKPGVFYTEHTCASSVFFRRRYNENLQRFEVRRVSLVTSRKANTRVPDYDRFFSWLTMTNVDVQPEHDNFCRRVQDDETRVKRYKSFFGGHRRSSLTVPETLLDRDIAIYRDVLPGLKYTWVEINNL